MSDRTWKQAVTEAIKKLGGREVELQDIYAVMKDDSLVTPHHKEIWGGRANYEHWIRNTLSRLCSDGIVVWVRRGTYSLT